MQRAFLPFSLLLALVLGVSSNAQATTLARPATVKDTIVVRLPNKAVITLMVRDAAQLRQLKKYQLDSLTSRLATYITQAEAAAKTASTNQVTMEFYPDKDQPGKNMPEQIRITTHKTPAGAASNNKVDVLMEKASKNTGVSFKIGGKTEAERRNSEAHRDSIRLKNFENHHTKSHLIFDLGLNTFVNQKTYLAPNGQPESLDLRTEGSRYVNIGLNWDSRLGGKHSPLSLTVGPEFAFNNYMLSGNNKWVNTNGRTDVVPPAAGSSASQPAPLPLSWSSARRGRLLGRADPNAELVLYAEAFARKIQLNMTIDQVRDAARQRHAHPLVTVAIRQDGSVESVSFVVSSGVPQIDEAIRRIVQSQAPYPAFSPALERDFDVIEIRRTWTFDMAVRLY